MKFKIDWSNYCAVCQHIHEPDVDCAGNPIDWQARKEKARQQLRIQKKRGEHWAKGYLEQSCNQE